MNGPSHLTAGELAQFAILAALFAASGRVWYFAMRRWSEGRLLIRLAARPVPWRGMDLFLVVLGSVVISFSVSLAANFLWPAKAAPAAGDEAKSSDHPAGQLLLSRDPREIALAATMAVIVAPAFEELIFRVLLQGWLEAIWSRLRRKRREFRAAPASWVPLLLPAVLFAMIHIRSAAPPKSDDNISRAFLVQMAVEITTIALAIILLRAVAGAKAADFGWSPRKLGFDARLALAALVAVTPLLLVFNVAMKVAFDWLSIPFAPDPIPLFFLALVFGWLYRRTHRLAPSLLMHAAFNATSIALLFLQPQG